MIDLWCHTMIGNYRVSLSHPTVSPPLGSAQLLQAVKIEMGRVSCNGSGGPGLGNARFGNRICSSLVCGGVSGRQVYPTLLNQSNRIIVLLFIISVWLLWFHLTWSELIPFSWETVNRLEQNNSNFCAGCSLLFRQILCHLTTHWSMSGRMRTTLCPLTGLWSVMFMCEGKK